METVSNLSPTFEYLTLNFRPFYPKQSQSDQGLNFGP